MRAPEFEASLVEARAYPELWRLALGIGLTLLLWLGTTALILAAAAAIVGAQTGPFGVMPWLTGLATPDTPGKVFALLATFFGLFVGALTATAALHGRGPATLLGPWPEWRRGFLTALAVMAPIYAGLVALSVVVDPPVPNLALGRWLMLLPLTLALILLQTSAEELFFRGYLQQQLAVRFRARWVWMGLPTLAFALLHWSPTSGANAPLVLLSALTFGLVAADLTERTGSLGAAMGLHFGNNLVGIAVVSIGDTITGLSLYTTARPIDETGTQSLALAFSILVLLAVWAITARLLDR